MSTLYGYNMLSEPYPILTEAFVDATRQLPQVPIAPGVGHVATELIDVGVPAVAVADWPIELRAEDLRVLSDSTDGPDGEHTKRRLPPVDPLGFRRAVGFVTASLITSAGEFAKIRGGNELPVIATPQQDPAGISDGLAALEDPTLRRLYAKALGIAVEAIDSDEAWASILPYRREITRISRLHRGVTPETDPEGFRLKVEALNEQRRLVAEALRSLIKPALFDGIPGHVSAKRLHALAHNLTRWQPAQAWFAPASPNNDQPL